MIKLLKQKNYKKLLRSVFITTSNTSQLVTSRDGRVVADDIQRPPVVGHAGEVLHSEGPLRRLCEAVNGHVVTDEVPGRK